ncbi:MULTISPECIES: restriction endonuclease subunit S [Streptomyces]|uniref:restriction endonuclease subunit S n=1 Tax=Streptomyces TaxID=1883 RepID=UPI0033D5A5CF
MTWPLLPLKRSVDPARPITYGIVQAGPDTPGGVPYIRPTDMTQGSGVPDPTKLLHTTEEIAASYGRSRVATGDIVVSIGPSYGKVMMVPEALAGANLTQGTARVAAAAGIEGRFLYWTLQTSLARKFWDASVGGATFRALNLEPLSRTPVPHVPLPQQRRIADFLDVETVRIDALIDARRRQVSVLDERLNSFREKLFGTDVTDGTPTPLMHLTDPYRPIVYGIVQAGPEVPEGVPYIKTGDLKKLHPSELSRTSFAIHEQFRRAAVHPGDIVMAMRASIGAVALVPPELPEANLTQGTARIAAADGISAEWLLQALQTRHTREQCDLRAVGSTFRTLNIWDLRRIVLTAVSSEHQQVALRRFGALQTKHHRVRQATQRQLALLAERRTALITAAVTGQFDVSTASGRNVTDGVNA